MSSARFSLLENICSILLLLLRHFYAAVERMSAWYLERRKEYVHLFALVFPLNSSQHWGCSAPSFSTSPPATHFNLINDPSPSTRLCFYRLLLNVDLLWPASLKRLLTITLMFMINCRVTPAFVKWVYLMFYMHNTACVFLSVRSSYFLRCVLFLLCSQIRSRRMKTS